MAHIETVVGLKVSMDFVKITIFIGVSSLHVTMTFV